MFFSLILQGKGLSCLICYHRLWRRPHGKGSGDCAPGQEWGWAVEKGRLSRHADHLSVAFSAARSLSLSRDKEAICCFYPSCLGRVAEGRCFQVLLLTRCLGLDVTVCGTRDTGHHFSMMWLDIRRGFYTLSSDPCDSDGWLEARDPSLPHVHRQTVSHQPFIALFCIPVKIQKLNLSPPSA